MTKKLFNIKIFALFVFFCFLNFAYAYRIQGQEIGNITRLMKTDVEVATPTLEGTWAIDGKMKAKLNVPAFLNLSLTLTNLAALGESFIFNSDGTFVDGFGLLAGDWSQSGANFTVDLDFTDIIASLNDLGLSATEKPGATFSGKIQKNGTIKGKFKVGFDLESSGMTGTLAISGNFVGTKQGGSVEAFASNPDALKEKSKVFLRTKLEKLLNAMTPVN